MRLSLDGQRYLGAVQGVYLNNQRVMPNAGLSSGGWDFFGSVIQGYGGWGALPGLYVANTVPPFNPTWVATGAAPLAVGLWSDGRSRWVGQYVDGARDSDGGYWPARAALGSSRQGDWLFVEKPLFASLVVRAADGSERTFQTGPLGGACMDDGVILYANANEPTAIGAATPRVPRLMPFVTIPGGDRWLAGYTPRWGLCLARWDLAPAGWLLSGDGLDNNPVVGWRSVDSQLVVVTAENTGETLAREYVIDLPSMTCVRNGGARWALQAVDLSTPPVDLPKFTHPVYTGVFFPSR